MEYCEDQEGTIIFYFSAVQGHSHGANINPKLFSLTHTVELEGTHIHTVRLSNCKLILENDLWAGGSINFEMHENSLLFLTS